MMQNIRDIKKIVLTIMVLFLIGCSENNNENSNPIGLNPIGGGEITFQIAVTQHQNDTYFEFTPSVDFKLTKLDASLNNQNQGTVNGDGTTVFKPSEPLLAGPASLSDGEVWTFTISGKIESNGKDFSVTVNYTVPQGTGGGTGNVTFVVSVHQQQGQDGFLLKPSVDIKVTKIDLKLNGNSAGSITGDGTTTFTAADGLFISLNNAATSGEKWEFVVAGTIANDGKVFTSTVNYTVP